MILRASLGRGRGDDNQECGLEYLRPVPGANPPVCSRPAADYTPLGCLSIPPHTQEAPQNGLAFRPNPNCGRPGHPPSSCSPAVRLTGPSVCAIAGAAPEPEDFVAADAAADELSAGGCAGDVSLLLARFPRALPYRPFPTPLRPRGTVWGCERVVRKRDAKKKRKLQERSNPRGVRKPTPFPR